MIQALVRIYATCDATGAASRQAALNQAQRLYQNVRNTDSAETMAMALAANNRFDAATQLQSQVITEVSTNPAADSRLRTLNENLNRYQNGQPAQTGWAHDDPIFDPPRIRLEDRRRAMGLQQ